MSCASCAQSIEKELQKLDGVKSCQVSFATETASIESAEQLDQKLIKKTIEQLGYGLNEASEVEQPQKNNELVLFYLALVLSLGLFVLDMLLMGWPSPKLNHWLQFLLAMPIWVWIGKRFRQAVWRFFSRGQSGMNTLIGLGTSAAFLYSSWITFFPQLSVKWGLDLIVYYEAVGFIICFVYLGQFFEARAKKKTQSILSSLMSLSAKKAWKLMENGEYQQVSLEQIGRGDRLRVRPSDKFPVDGEVLKGSSHVEESMLTGESLPVLKNVGDKVYAGTINEDGILEVKALALGEETLLQQLVSYVKKAQDSRPEIQRYADRVSSVFTPIVMLIAVLTLLAWGLVGGVEGMGMAVSHFIAVLVIACPCALGLATPTAVVVAVGKATSEGLLIAGGEVIERAEKIDTLVVDKTGTVTQGKPRVLEVRTVDADDEAMLKLVASIQQLSHHPLAKAIVHYAQKKNIELVDIDSFQEVKGKGVVASLAGDEIILGSKGFLVKNKISWGTENDPKELGSHVFVAKNKKFWGYLVIGDQLRDGASDTLHSLGMKLWMLTGDHEKIAGHVARQLGIENFQAQLDPVGKAKKIEQLQLEGSCVAMLGDGINDAPALSKADLSFAMGEGTDVAINAASITLMRSDLALLKRFFSLSRRTMKTIRQNLFLSFLYNTLLIPIAAGVLIPFGGPSMPPVLASVAMALSSISVVGNSLRLRRA